MLKVAVALSILLILVVPATPTVGYNAATKTSIRDCIAANVTLPYDGESGAILDDPLNGDIYIGASDGLVYVFNLSSQMQVAVLSAAPNIVAAFSLDLTNDHIFVTGFQPGDNVTVIDGSTNRVVTNITAGGDVQGMAFDPANGMVYVAGIGTTAPGITSNGNFVTIINASTDEVVGAIHMGNLTEGLTGVAVDPSIGHLYVGGSPIGATNASGNVTIFNTTTNSVVGTVSVGDLPLSMSVDELNHKLFVVNPIPGSVSVIDGMTGTLEDTVEMAGASPSNSFMGSVYDEDTDQIIVQAVNANGNGRLVVLNASDGAILGNMSLGANEWTFALTSNPSTGVVYATSSPQQLYTILPSGGCTVPTVVKAKTNQATLLGLPGIDGYIVTGVIVATVTVVVMVVLMRKRPRLSTLPTSGGNRHPEEQLPRLPGRRQRPKTGKIVWFANAGVPVGGVATASITLSPPRPSLDSVARLDVSIFS